MKKSLGPKTVLYPTPILVVGTYDEQGRPNVMTAAWGGICCSSPPCVSVSLRKATYSYGNLVRRGAFTISVPSEDHIKEVDFFGMVSGREGDKFSRAGLTPVRADHVDAPYVGEFPLVLECKLMKTVEIGLHTLFVGEVMDLKVEESALAEDGRPDIERVKPFSFTPESRTYYATGRFLGKAFSLGKEIKDR
ncbi:MAG: flavin reductase family protein [Thermodesulfovibrionales bacterium]